MDVKLWGVRGSIPTPSQKQEQTVHLKRTLDSFCKSVQYETKNVDEYLEQIPNSELIGWGGNTTCVEVVSGSKNIIIDAGSGIRPLGLELLSGKYGKEFHILLTHFHWDHLLGLPFFVPIFLKGYTLHFYAVQDELETVVRTLFSSPFFPITFKMLASNIQFHRLAPRQTVTIQDFYVTPYMLDHPNPCWGYKIEETLGAGKALAYCVDTECTRMTGEQMGEDLPLYTGVDTMIFDSQYSLNEVVEKANWGHSAATIGLDIGIREKMKRVVFSHHDPSASSDKISLLESQMKKYHQAIIQQNSAASEISWMFGFEGMVIKI